MTTTKTFKAGGMHCSSCSMLISISLEELAGVQSVDCNHATGITAVTFDETAVDVDRIRQTIVESGYTAELVG